MAYADYETEMLERDKRALIEFLTINNGTRFQDLSGNLMMVDGRVHCAVHSLRLEGKLEIRHEGSERGKCYLLS